MSLCPHGTMAGQPCGTCIQNAIAAQLCGHGYPRDTCQRCQVVRADRVNHPAHYGGADNPYEAIKVIEAWELGFCLGNAVKYICRAGKKEDTLEDLKKAAWYLNREIERLK